MHIDMWTDIACPWCYLGIRYLRGALRAFKHGGEVEVACHAYFLDPELSESLDISETDYLVHNRGIDSVRVHDMHARLIVLGNTVGITYDFEHSVVAPTSNAHRVMVAAYEHDLAQNTLAGADTTQLRLAESLYKARFEQGRDISAPEVLVSCAQDVGMDAQEIVEALSDEQKASQVFSDYQIAVQMGVETIPLGLIDRQFVIQGSQSLEAMGNMLNTAWEHRKLTA